LSYEKAVKELKPTDKKKIMANRALMAGKLRSAAAPKKRRIRQTFDRLVVLAVSTNNVPKESEGWTATLTRNNATVATASFDEFGAVRFPTISTLTTVSYVLRIRNADGNLLAQRNIPADREFYVAIF